ncbi:MAG: glycoside hydrolase family 88 protein [Bacteroidales bacterium]|nr:glycoside hydrolase family 88 protein [Bacteroidales bacterium]MCM1414560.1 glycoside hydrolase family 88 protein [bacterium]MCM1422610.1 glycoside hydrolase family 88 protein [bacterium]
MNKIPLAKNACTDLLQYGVFDRKAKGKYWIKRYLLRRKAAGEDLIFWPTGLLASGLWQYKKELGKPEAAEEQKTLRMIEQTLAAYYERWFQKGMPLTVLDDLLAGETLAEIYGEMQSGNSVFCAKLSADQIRLALDRMAGYAAVHPKDAAGSFFYRPLNGEKTVFVDGIGLAVPFLYRYGELSAEQAYQELAVRQIENFLSDGMDGATGLPYHGYDTAAGCKCGIIGWGRAVGWLLRGMVGCMTSDYGREKVRAHYTELVEKAISFQRSDGYFSWQLAALEGPADTSATGMICAAVRDGMKLGVLSGSEYEAALSLGRCALERSVRNGRVYDCSGECEGFSCYPQRYGAYPWSLGPALAVLQADRKTAAEPVRNERALTEMGMSGE